MKNIIKMIVSFIISMLLFTLSLCFKSAGDKLLESLSMVLGIVFISLFCTILGIKISKKMNEKNTLLIVVTAFFLCFLMYFGYLFLGDVSINTVKNINFVYTNIILTLFYISLLLLILCLAMVFYFWISNKKNGKLLKYFIFNLIIYIVVVLLGFLVNDRVALLLAFWQFAYFISLASLATFFFVFVGYKIIFPTKK